MSKILTVFGATGQQGGSVITNVLENPQLAKTYKIRAVTRDASKPKAKALADKGAEVVTAELDDRASVFAAIKGSSAVFGITDFWTHMVQDREIAQGKNIADGAKEAGVEHLIWSSLSNISKATNGENTHVKHFDSKARVEEYIREIGVPASFVMPGIFMQAMNGFFKPNEEGVYSLYIVKLPKTAQFTLIDIVSDMGLYVAACLLKPELTQGQRLIALDKFYTPEETREIYAKVTGRKTAVVEITEEQFKGNLPPPVAEELTANFKLFGTIGYYAGEPDDALEKGKAVLKAAGLRETVSWEQFCKNIK